MAVKTLQLNIVSAEASIFSGEVQRMEVTGQQGELGIHPGHTALISPLKPGQVGAVLTNGELEYFYISGGMLEVQPHTVTVLADTALRAEDIDEAAVLQAKERAEKQLADRQSEIDHTQALAELAELAAQLKALKSLRRH